MGEVCGKVKQNVPWGVEGLEKYNAKAVSEVKQNESRAVLAGFEDRLTVCIEQDGGGVSKTMLRQYQARMKREKAQRAKRRWEWCILGGEEDFG